MKKNLIRYIILGISFVLLLFLFLSNTIFSVNISNDLSEITTIKFNNFLYMIIIFLILIIAYRLLDIIDLKLSKKAKRIIFIIILVLFTLVQIIWIEYRNLYPYGDQLSVYQIAKFIVNNNTAKLIHNKYLEFCPQQINISLIWALIFKLFNSTNIKIIQYINVISNIVSLITLLKITDILGTKYEINKTRLVFLFTSFIPISLLSTFPYGDLPGLSLSLLSILFILKYTNTNKLKYFFISSIFIALACFIRINYIIFFIAIVIYLIMDLIKRCKLNDFLIKSLLIIIFMLVTIIPTQAVKTTFQNKYELNTNNSLPTPAYLYIAMTESERGNGWYGANILYAWEHPGESNAYYKKEIIKRLNYFKNHPFYFIEFYVKKEISMWDENTYQSIWYNESFNIYKESHKNYNIDNQLLSIYKYIFGWQKLLVLMISSISVYYVFKKFKSIDNDITLFLLIFIGGFMFHTLWEAKSRYVIPYLIILFIVSSVRINFNKNKDS